MNVGVVDLSAFARWYAFRGISDWAADFLERARAAGAHVSDLELARSYWLGRRAGLAHSAFRHPHDRGQAPADYLDKCLRATTVRNGGDIPAAEYAAKAESLTFRTP